MKKCVALFAVLLSLFAGLFAQTKPRQKPPAQTDTNKMMEDVMKTEGMTEEEKTEMRKMMQNVLPTMEGGQGVIAQYPSFNSNMQLLPEKGAAKIGSVQGKKLSQADIGNYATDLFNKIMKNGDAEEIKLIKSVILKSPGANDLGSIAILCMLEGHPQAAMALSMKAVQADPANPNWQNNMASILTQYGYPEQAVPVLQKLRNDFPSNSTVLNNMAHAWLGLGEIDSAKAVIRKAGGLNPYHPEVKQTEGVIDEATGNPEKATQEYVESLENSINPFSEILINNISGESSAGALDFEKIKRSITIHEYFHKNWMPEPPLLSSTVSGHPKDYATQMGFDEMHSRLVDKLTVMTNALSGDLQETAEGGQDEFIKTMTKEMQKGINLMSKPAGSVLLVLSTYYKKWKTDYDREVKELNEKKNEYTKVFEAATANLKSEQCAQYDIAANSYMKSVNPMVRDFYLNKAEEFRQYVNAYITWNWYVAGNPKNVILIQDLGFVGMLDALYQSAMIDQETIEGRCKSQNPIKSLHINDPVIPDFTCPVLVSIPFGKNWQELTAASKNFDNNSHGVKNSPATAIPNQTISYGTDHASIAEPGQDPFIKVSNGSVTPVIIEAGNNPSADLARQLQSYKNNRSADFKPAAGSPEAAAESVGNDIKMVLATEKERAIQEHLAAAYYRETVRKRLELEAAQEQKAEEYYQETVRKRLELEAAQEKRAEEYYQETVKKRLEAEKAAQAQEDKNTEFFKEYLKSKIEHSKSPDYKSDLDKAIEEKIRQANNSKMANELVKKMMSADCNGKTPTKKKAPVFEVGYGKLEIESSSIEIKEVKEEDGVTYVSYSDGSSAIFMLDGSILQISAPINREINTPSTTIINPKIVPPDVVSKDKTYGDLKNAKKQFDANGLQPSVSSGIQAPGIFKVIKDLFK
jgi:hypothetical protein